MVRCSRSGRALIVADYAHDADLALEIGLSGAVSIQRGGEYVAAT